MELHSNDKGMSLFSDFIAAHCHNISLLSFPGGSDRKKIHYPIQKKKKNPPGMWETWVQSLGWEGPLEKGTATHSSILAWRVPQTEEPGGP